MLIGNKLSAIYQAETVLPMAGPYPEIFALEDVTEENFLQWRK